MTRRWFLRTLLWLGVSSPAALLAVARTARATESENAWVPVDLRVDPRNIEILKSLLGSLPSQPHTKGNPGTAQKRLHELARFQGYRELLDMSAARAALGDLTAILATSPSGADTRPSPEQRYLLWLACEAEQVVAIGVQPDPPNLDNDGNALRHMRLPTDPALRDRLIASVRDLIATAGGFSDDGLGTYTGWGGSSCDPGVCAAAVTSMGIVSDMGVLNDLLGEKNSFGLDIDKRNGIVGAWSDVLLHILLFLSADSVYRTKPEEAPLSCDPAGYTELYRIARGAAGSLEAQVRISQSPESGQPQKWACYRYNDPNPQNFPTLYQQASCAYLRLAAAKLLEQLITAIEPLKVIGSLGTFYKLKRTENAPHRWVSEDGSKPRIEIDLMKGRYVGINVTTDGKSRDLDANVRADLAGLISKLAPNNKLAEKLMPNGQELRRHALCMYAIGRLLVAAGHPDAISGFFWHREFVSRIKSQCDAGVTDRDWLAFAILTLTRGYRPLFRAPPPA